MNGEDSKGQWHICSSFGVALALSTIMVPTSGGLTCLWGWGGSLSVLLTFVCWVLGTVVNEYRNQEWEDEDTTGDFQSGLDKFLHLSLFTSLLIDAFKGHWERGGGRREVECLGPIPCHHGSDNVRSITCPLHSFLTASRSKSRPSWVVLDQQDNMCPHCSSSEASCPDIPGEAHKVLPFSSLVLFLFTSKNPFVWSLVCPHCDIWGDEGSLWGVSAQYCYQEWEEKDQEPVSTGELRERCPTHLTPSFPLLSLPSRGMLWQYPTSVDPNVLGSWHSRCLRWRKKPILCAMERSYFTYISLPSNSRRKSLFFWLRQKK